MQEQSPSDAMSIHERLFESQRPSKRARLSTPPSPLPMGTQMGGVRRDETSEDIAIGALMALQKREPRLQEVAGSPAATKIAHEIAHENPMVVEGALKSAPHQGLSTGQQFTQALTQIDATTAPLWKIAPFTAPGCAGSAVDKFFNSTIYCLQTAVRKGVGGGFVLNQAWGNLKDFISTNPMLGVAMAGGTLALGTWLGGLWTAGGIATQVCVTLVTPLTSIYEASQMCGAPLPAAGVLTSGLQFAEAYLPFGGAMAGVLGVGQQQIVNRYDTAARAIFVCVTGLIAVAFGGWSGALGAGVNRTKQFIGTLVTITRQWLRGETTDIVTLAEICKVNWQELTNLIGADGRDLSVPNPEHLSGDLLTVLQAQNALLNPLGLPGIGIDGTTLRLLTDAVVAPDFSQPETLAALLPALTQLIDQLKLVGWGGGEQGSQSLKFLNLLITYKATITMIFNLQGGGQIDPDHLAAMEATFKDLMDVATTMNIDKLLTAEQTFLALARPPQGGGKRRSRKKRSRKKRSRKKRSRKRRSHRRRSRKRRGHRGGGCTGKHKPHKHKSHKHKPRRTSRRH